MKQLAIYALVTYAFVSVHTSQTMQKSYIGGKLRELHSHENIRPETVQKADEQELIYPIKEHVLANPIKEKKPVTKRIEKILKNWFRAYYIYLYETCYKFHEKMDKSCADPLFEIACEPILDTCFKKFG